MSDEKRPTQPWVWAVAGVIGAGLAIYCAVSPGDTQVKEKSAVRVECQEQVKERLKSPSTADFSDVEVSADGDLYTVSGVVDAENSFGAKTRSSWTCTARNDGSTVTDVSVDLD